MARDIYRDVPSLDYIRDHGTPEEYQEARDKQEARDREMEAFAAEQQRLKMEGKPHVEMGVAVALRPSTSEKEYSLEEHLAELKRMIDSKPLINHK